MNLLESVIRGQQGNLIPLLERGADPNARAEGGMTALMYAAERGDTLMIRILVLNGADTELSFVEKTSPLMVAVLNRNFPAAHWLLKLGANPNARDEYGGNCLVYSAATNQYDMADLLLFYGADPGAVNDDGNDALMTAVSMGHIETADVLLQNNLDPDSRDIKMNTPLMVATQMPDTAMMILLMEYGADLEAVNKQNYTPLAHAVHLDRKSAARLLAGRGADIHHKVRTNMNLYDLALRQHHRQMANWLKSEGASPTPGPDFSQVLVLVSNSIGKNEYLLQGRFRLPDRKSGIFLESGVDFRPIPYRVLVEVNDTLLHQYREYRWAWAHGIGKEFVFAADSRGLEIGGSAALYGLLSFPYYRGISGTGPAKYSLAPAAGLFVRGDMAGIQMGVERYSFGTVLEGKWEFNIGIFFRVPLKNEVYGRKEAAYAQIE